MMKIAHVKEVDMLKGLPSEVVDVVRDAVIILDEAYGENRVVDSGDGGYVLIINSEDELGKLNDVYIDVETVIPEYVEIVECIDGKIFASSLILLGSDFGVLLIMSLVVLPANLKKYISAYPKLKEDRTD